MWTYGIQLWGCTKKTNLEKVQTFQNKVLRSIVNARWYIRNDNLHRDLNVEYVSKIIIKYADKDDHRIQIHNNPIMRHEVEEAPQHPEATKKTEAT